MAGIIIHIVTIIQLSIWINWGYANGWDQMDCIILFQLVKRMRRAIHHQDIHMFHADRKYIHQVPEIQIFITKILLMFSVEMNYILIYQCGTMIRKEVYFPTYMCMIVVRNLMIIQDI